MLEQALAENTAVLRELLTLIRNNSQAAFSNADVYAQQKAISDEPALSHSETKAAAVAILAEAKEATAPEGIKYEAVVAVVQRMAAAGQRDAVVNALTSLGCATARNLHADQYAEFLEMLNQASA